MEPVPAEGVEGPKNKTTQKDGEEPLPIGGRVAENEGADEDIEREPS